REEGTAGVGDRRGVPGTPQVAQLRSERGGTPATMTISTDDGASPTALLTAFLAERSPEEADALMHDLRRLSMTYKFGIDEVMTKISILRDEFRHLRHYNPVEH